MTLVSDLQRVFERTYGLKAGVDLDACVVGPRRCAELTARAEHHDEMSDLARFFYYLENANLKLALFFDARMIAPLEERDPRTALSESNVLPFLVLAEELSHAVHTTFVFTESGGRRISDPAFLEELELLARIDAYLVLRLFVRGLSRRFTARDRAWVRRQALTRWDVGYDDPRLGRRYRGAVRQAARFVDHLEDLSREEQLDALRAFRRLPLHGKQAFLRGLR